MCVIRTLDERPSTFIRDKPMLHKDYDRKSSGEQKSLWKYVSLKELDAKTK
jgi:hypothetical protein